LTNNYILDACALIAFLNEENGGEKVNKIIIDAYNYQAYLNMNVFNLLEVYYGLYRVEGEQKSLLMLNEIFELPINIIYRIKTSVFYEAARLKATYKISLADSIVLAEASVSGGLLLTSDHHEFDIIERYDPKINFCWIR
jgi:PIN domain nuclease of toxin-antitoxin system